jgi:predicted ATP-dependent endonuclease of OLD family
MHLSKITIRNYRSIDEIVDVRIEQFQGIVGENNAGKSNILKAVGAFLQAGAGGVTQSDFRDPTKPIVIEVCFDNLSSSEYSRIKQYLISGQLRLIKEISMSEDEKTNKNKVVSEYHGYKAEPIAWWLSLGKIEEKLGARPRWREIAEENGILEYVTDANGNVNKTSYKKGIERYIQDNPEIEFETPTLGETQALGLQTALLSNLPKFYLLPAITDYSDEIDKRSSNTFFRRLMAELSDQLLSADPRFQEVKDALSKIDALLNPKTDSELPRLPGLGKTEAELKTLIAEMMPSVRSVNLQVNIGDVGEIFSRGVSLSIDDGVDTDVLEKGHGLQRSVVFSLLRRLIDFDVARNTGTNQSIILGIEEPELYIHPHTQRLIYNVIKKFSERKDELGVAQSQVVYTTHSPAFIDIAEYERIAVAQKGSVEEGTRIFQTGSGVLGSADERATFKLLTSFSLVHNYAFFAKHVVVVEGPQDEIAFIATLRKLEYVNELPEEIGIEVLVTNGKQDIPKFLKVLNAFEIPYSLLLEMDGKGEEARDNAQLIQLAEDNIVSKIPDNLETLVGAHTHFKDIFYAKTFFGAPESVNEDAQRVFGALVPDHLKLG